MTCDDKKPLVHALADGELDVIHAREIEAHIATCADCAATYAEVMALKQRLAMPGLRLQAPAHLAQRIALALPAATPAPVAKLPVAGAALTVLAPLRELRNAWALRLQGALAGAGGALAVAACLAFFVMRVGTSEDIAASLVDGHLRSLQASHLFDVQSTDQHTVKPWFAGKLAVTPPVPDLALKGFTLVGGRIDYVRGRAAAVVVYRRRTHVINLFVWPGTEAAPEMTELSGYFLRHWTQDGLTFWAVSDIAEPELAEFEAAYQAAPGHEG
jgi:anti-sigma factor RsiW